MNRIFLIAGAVLVLLVGALMIVPRLIPSDVYRDRIESAASEALGRKVTVTGDIRLSVFPRIEARAGATTVANPPNFGDAPFASMNELRAAVKLWPLLFRRVEIDEFVLVEPNIALVNLENGANNWTFTPAAPPRPPGEAPPGKPASVGASLGDVRIVKGQVSWDNRAENKIQNLSDLNLRAEMRAMDKPFNITASGLANALPFDLKARIENPKAMIDGMVSKVDIALETDLIRTRLDGTLKLGEIPEFDFAFDANIPSATELADAFQVADLPARAALGRISASGQAFGNAKDITLKVADARHESPLLNADFNGEMRVADFITMQIDAKADAPRLAELAAAMDIAAPSGVLGKASATTKISGPLGDLRFTDVNFRHDGGLLGITFTGAARLRADLTYDGRFGINAPDLRALAKATGAVLPEGDIYRSFAFSGETSGSTRDVKLRNAVVEFDSIRGTGEAALTFAGKPRLVGSLSTGLIDVTPYALASGAPEDKSAANKGWGKDPVDLSPLRLADADLTIKAQGLKFQKFDFGASDVAVALKGGKLTADLKQTALFGGGGAATLVADGSGATPSVALRADLKGLGLKPLLDAAANFTMVEGAGDLKVEIAGAGPTLDALMSSLVGSGSMNFRNGTIQGVDLPALGAAAQNALTTRSIPLAAFGKSASTKFGGMNASFTMKDGVAAMSNLKLDGDTYSVSGGGMLDIGKQTLSLSLYPEYKNQNVGVKGYGLPVKLAGGWSGVNLTLDFDWLVDRATADVRTRVNAEIESELRQQLGTDLSNLLGIGRNSGQPASAPAPAPVSQPAETPAATEPAPATPAETVEQRTEAAKEAAEERLRKEAEKALGGLFKRN